MVGPKSRHVPRLSLSLANLLVASLLVTTATAATFEIIPIRDNSYRDDDPRFPDQVGGRNRNTAMATMGDDTDRVRGGWTGQSLRAQLNVPIGAALSLLEFELPTLMAGETVTKAELQLTYSNEAQNPLDRTNHFEEVGGVNMANWPPPGISSIEELTWNLSIGPDPNADQADVLIQGGFDIPFGNPNNQIFFGGYNSTEVSTASRINWNPNFVVPFDEIWGPLPGSDREPLVQSYPSETTGNTLLSYVQANIGSSDTVILTLGPAFAKQDPLTGENLNQYYSKDNIGVVCCMPDGETDFDPPLPPAPPLLILTVIPEPTSQILLLLASSVALLAGRRR